MIRRLVAGLIVVGLAIGIWALWPREDSTTTTTTPPTAVASTTTSSVAMSTSTIEVTTSSGADSHVVTTVEEAEEILRQLWFGWFEGIYNQDEERIKEVVGSPNQVQAAVAQFGQLEMARAPAEGDFDFANVELLLSSEECTVIWARMSVTGFSDAVLEGVHVFRRLAESWLFVSLWTHRDDLWEGDCAAQF